MIKKFRGRVGSRDYEAEREIEQYNREIERYNREVDDTIDKLDDDISNSQFYGFAIVAIIIAVLSVRFVCELIITTR